LKKLKIAYVTPRYFPYVGGVEYVVKNLAERLVLKGHEVTVVAGAPHEKKFSSEKINGVDVFRVPTYVISNSYHIPKEKESAKRIFDNSFDIVHAHSIHAVFSFLPIEVKSDGATWKLVITPHHSTTAYTLMRSLIWKLYWKRRITTLLKQADLVHVTSPIEAATVSKRFPVAKNKLVLIPLGIEEDVLNYIWKGQNSDYLVFCGRLEKYKGVDLAIQAVSILTNGGYKIRLIIAGSGSQAKEIDALCRNVGTCVSHIPPLPRDDYLKLVSNARGAISLSSAENFNIFLAEAYAMGVPVIATKEAAAFRPELANVTEFDPHHVAEAILEKLNTKTQVEFDERSIKTWDEVVDTIESAYNSIL
jgi:glycosyltransferase involved in cell wall biosynthesis